jgi:hypothetical protein
MAKIVMPGTRDTNARVRVWMPPGASAALAGDVIAVCRIPTSFDEESGETVTCRQRFVKGQERLAERHIAECAAKHEDVIRAISEKRRPEIMLPQDKEYYAWMQAHKRGIAEGRVKW